MSPKGCFKGRGALRSGAAPVASLADGLLEQVPGPAADVPWAADHPVPSEGFEEAFFGDMIRPELHEVRALLGRALFEGRKEPMGVALVPLVREDADVEHLRDAATNGVAQAADPVADLVSE